MSNKFLRISIPFLGLLALVTLFLKLPETPDVFSFLGCKLCSTTDPYLPLIGAGYFALLIAISLLFPRFPSKLIARGGLVFSVLLFAALSYVHLPDWCPACLICHACHILMWTIWLATPSLEKENLKTSTQERLYLTFFAPLCVVALFSCMNLTFMAYGFKMKTSSAATTLQIGQSAPSFAVKTILDRSVASLTDPLLLNFISAECTFCKEQLPILNTIAASLPESSYRIVNVSSRVPPELIQYSPQTEWIEDKGGMLRELFKVAGFPTLFIVESDGKIAQIIPGVPEKLESKLIEIIQK